MASGKADFIRQQMYAVGFRQALSPVFDISRDPRWGRVTETYGEDPTLASAMGVAFVRGIQGKDHTKGIAATAKHFVGHGVPEGGLNMGRVIASRHELEEVHCKPFQAAITECGLMSVMNAYCSFDGEPVVCSKHLLTDLLRGNLGFEGAVVSDYVSIDRIIDPFCLAEDYADAGVQAISAGLDVEYPRPKCFTYDMEKAIKDGLLDMETVDQAVRRVLAIKFELGLFEHPYPDVDLLKSLINTERGKDMGMKLAQESITLLKNENNLLPLSRNVKKIAVIGPHANLVRSYFATFSYPAALDMTLARNEDGQELPEPGLIVYDIQQRFPGDCRESSPGLEVQLKKEYPDIRTLYEAVEDYLPGADVTWSLGCNYLGNNLSGMEHALAAAAQADVIILTLGGKNGWGVVSTVGEGVDSTSIDLPGRQEEFARAVYALKKPCAVVHFDGRPLSNEYVATHFDAILEAWQPGEYGGQALCSVIFGDYNPAGRLPVTAARNAGQIPIYYSLPRGSGYVSAGHTGMIRNPNGYINDTAFPLYFFGHGLSYTTFEYKNFAVEKREIGPAEKIIAAVTISNTGDRDGDEVVQLYCRDEIASAIRPDRELIGFVRVPLKVGETKTVRFSFPVTQLAFLGSDMEWVIEKGGFTLLVGSSSNDIRQQAGFSLTATQKVNGRTRGFFADSEILIN